MMHKELNTLKKMRLKNKLTYQNMADKLEMSKTFYWQIENGKRRLNYEVAKKIAAIFKLKPDDIFYKDL